MEPSCRRCDSPKYLQDSAWWKTGNELVVAGRVCVWCGHVERGVYILSGSPREEHGEESAASL